MVISSNTIQLLGDITKPLASSGVLPKSERLALIQILKKHSPESLARNLPKGKKGLTVRETCEALNVSRSTVGRMLKNNELAGHYLRPGSPKTLRIDPASVDALLSGEVAK